MVDGGGTLAIGRALVGEQLCEQDDVLRSGLSSRLAWAESVWWQRRMGGCLGVPCSRMMMRLGSGSLFGGDWIAAGRSLG